MLCAILSLSDQALSQSRWLQLLFLIHITEAMEKWGPIELNKMHSVVVKKVNWDNWWSGTKWSRSICCHCCIIFCVIFAIVMTHWGRVTHICVSKHSILGSDNGLSPGRRQAIIWTNAGILLIWQSGTKFSEILIEIHKFPFKKMHLKTSSAKWRPFCLGLNVIILTTRTQALYLHYFMLYVTW